ncbi:DUF4226 domain-containing protein [Mycobacterium sp.]|uniref:DUF4226 domain-containing protein n=1 Tax=Mycobacterium sp. TaxID=1785 RepID=UPI0031DF14DD
MQGDAAAVIRDAESSLAHQISITAQLDLQVVSAILNAHHTAVQGRDALDSLQNEVEAAVRIRTDLDTPSGARDFQRYLVGKLRDIRTVVADASLDETSKSALMAAWTSLYDVARTTPTDAAPTAATDSRADEPPALSDDGIDPDLEALLADDPVLTPAGVPAQSATPPVLPSVPNLGGATIPSVPGLGTTGGFPLAGLPLDAGRDHARERVDDAPPAPDDAEEPESPTPVVDGDDDHAGESSPAPEPAPPAGPTTVALPNGDTVTAASPQLAAAIKAAAGGMSIPDAFRQQGIAIPPPGTAVTDPIDSSRLAPGDIGMFTTRHALALGDSKALLDGQIQHVSTVTGPGFLGWEHPPAPVTAGAPAGPVAPAPTRPAAAAG